MAAAAGQAPVRVRVPATSANLGAGYDCLGIALQLHLTVTATPLGADGTSSTDVGGRSSIDGPTEGRELVVTTGHGAETLSKGDDNLVHASMVRWCRLHDVDVPNVTLAAHNAIPLARGLGSSSAAIVAGLMLGRALTAVEASVDDVVALATQIEGHPDNVAPALLGGFVAGGRTDTGDTVVTRGDPTDDLTVVAAIPANHQLTSEARAMVPDAVPVGDVVTQVGRATHVTGALLGAWPPDVALSGDRLHEPARLPHMPTSRAVLTAWRADGALSWLSGAGPTAIALVANDPDRIARTMQVAGDALAARGAGHEVIHLPFDRSGTQVQAMTAG